MKSPGSRERYMEKRRARQQRIKRRRIALLLLTVAALGVGVLVALPRIAPPPTGQQPEHATPPNVPPGMTTATPWPTLPATVAPPVAPTNPADPADPTAEAPTAAAEQPPTPAGPPTDDFFDPQRFSYAPDFYQPQIDALLQARGSMLADVRFQIGDRSHSFAETLVNLSNLYSFNPKMLLALLEQQSQLLSTPAPTTEQSAWALGFRGEGGKHEGLYSQVRWGAIELRRALRDYAISAQTGTPLPPLRFDDEEERTQEMPPETTLARYVLARLLARTTTPDMLPQKLATFQQTYTGLFGDPRYPLPPQPPTAEPFLQNPLERPVRVTSFFDHDTPFLQPNGSLVAFWGNGDFYSYDGHTGWDYAAVPPDRVLAAADGTVVFAGNSDDGCYTPAQAVILDHGNGYRTLSWHLSAITVEPGQRVQAGEQIGVVGSSGCSIGPHLHFQVQYLGRDVDPYGWCGDRPDPWAANPAGQESVWLWDYMPSPCAPPPSEYIVVDDSSPGFAVRGEWQQSSLGYAGSARFSSTGPVDLEAPPWQVRRLNSTPNVALWQPELPRPGSYRVLAYVPYILNGLDDARTIRYQVRHSSGASEVLVNGEVAANAWVDLGIYTFDPADESWVSVSSLSDDGGRGIWVDAVAWVPVE